MAILTSKSYDPGDVIHIEKPFIRILRHDLWDKVCAGCCERGKVLKKCGACGIMQYCGKSCQKGAWKDHKLECPYLRNYTYLRCQHVVQMIGNLILKLKGKDWKTVTSSILGTEVSFDDLLSNSDHMIKTLKVNLLHDIEFPLLLYIGKENMPDKATLRELFGKVSTNRFGFGCGDPYESRNRMIAEQKSGQLSSNLSDGAVLFIGLSKIDHSCIPNALYDITGASVTVRAIRSINQSEKVTIGYCDMVKYLTSTSYNKLDFMKQTFRENCYCSDCSQPYGESKLTKILDMSKAPEVLEETVEMLENIRNTTLKNPGLELEEIVSHNELQSLLEKQNKVLGRTNLRRMQLLEVMHLLHEPKKEKLAGYVELTKCMEEVWGEYEPELLRYYHQVARLNYELKNEKKAKEYRFKIWRLESVMFGKFKYKEWENTLPESQLRTFNRLAEF